MGEIVQFNRPINPGNGAVEALDQFFDNDFWHHAWNSRFGHTTLSETEFMLAWLWDKGFKVVPIDG